MFKHVYKKRGLYYLRITLKIKTTVAHKNAAEKEKRN
jgi:hypothetical protein